MAELDRFVTEEFGIDVLVLMENAGVAVANLAREMLGGSVVGKRIVCLSGKGNNGGDGLVAARHLHNWGASMVVVLAEGRGGLRDAPARQLAVLDKMGLDVAGPERDFTESKLLVDALLGYGARGDPRGPVAGVIRRANESGVPILAVDLPSGLDATSGKPNNPCIKARATVTFGLPKTGFLNPEARTYVGNLYVADISFPAGAYRRYSQKVVFQKGALARIW
jgi:NAD(P)H-hydrate epimerase